MDFFDDDATSQAPARDARRRRRIAPPLQPPPHPHPAHRSSSPRSSSSSCSLLAWWARSCQQNRKVASYRTYFEGVSTAIDDSDALGKQLDQIVANPTKFSRKELIAKLDELSAKQNEIAVRADRLEPPDTLDAEQAVFAEGMKVRADGFKLFETTLLGDPRQEEGRPPPSSPPSAGYFSGPDAYYMSRVYTPARNTS